MSQLMREMVKYYYKMHKRQVLMGTSSGFNNTKSQNDLHSLFNSSIGGGGAGTSSQLNLSGVFGGHSGCGLLTESVKNLF